MHRHYRNAVLLRQLCGNGIVIVADYLNYEAAGMDGNEILGRLNRLSKVQTIKDVPQLTTALFPGTHCPLMGAAMVAGGIDDCLLVIVGTDECSYYTKSLTINERYPRCRFPRQP